MFEELSGKLNATLQRLTGRGVLTEDAVKEGLREIRRILLEADVSFDLTREFLERVQEKAIGASAIKDVRPGHQLVKIVYDELVALLGGARRPSPCRWCRRPSFCWLACKVRVRRRPPVSWPSV